MRSWFLLFTASLSGCGSLLSLNQPLNVQMVGVFEAADPNAAEADVPSQETFTLTGISLKPSDGSAAVALFNGSRVLKIIDRPQIIYSQDLSAYVGKSFSEVDVSFAPTITAAGNQRSDYTVSLSQDSVALVSPITVTHGQATTVTVHVNWRNTLVGSGSSESVLPPSLSAVLGE